MIKEIKTLITIYINKYISAISLKDTHLAQQDFVSKPSILNLCLKLFSSPELKNSNNDVLGVL